MSISRDTAVILAAAVGLVTVVGVTVATQPGTMQRIADSTGMTDSMTWADPSSRPSSSPTSSPAPSPSPSPALSAPPVEPTAAPAPSPSPTPTPTLLVYTVQPGDTLNDIAAWFAFRGHSAVFEANRAIIGSNPDLIRPGQKITIPGVFA